MAPFLPNRLRRGDNGEAVVFNPRMRAAGLMHPFTRGKTHSAGLTSWIGARGDRSTGKKGLHCGSNRGEGYCTLLPCRSPCTPLKCSTRAFWREKEDKHPYQSLVSSCSFKNHQLYQILGKVKLLERGVNLQCGSAGPWLMSGHVGYTGGDHRSSWSRW